jgi:drug/metabolite transporter (DMT)-like permease
VADLPFLPAEGAAVERSAATGYAMVVAASILFGLNGTVSKIILGTGLSSLRVTEVRCAGALLGLLAIVLATRPARLRISRRELAFLACFGILGVALVQLFYFLAIHRLHIGVALVIQYLGPLLVALWARFVGKEYVRRRLWVALALALGGLSLVVDLWGGVSLDGLGVVFALVSAATFAAYLLLAEHAVGRRDPVSLLCYGFLFASVFWAIVQPWWSFPFAVPGERTSLHGNLASLHLPVWALIAWMVVAGTIVPFFLIVGALRHLPATRVGVLAMLEPVVATVVAFAWLDETLGAEQLAGGAIVLAGIVLAQTAR